MIENTGLQRFGADVQFRLWAPDARSVELVLDGAAHEMTPDARGLFTLNAPAAPGTPYRFRIDGGSEVPDPAARAQAGDVGDASLVVDQEFAWKHADWTGRPWEQTVIYELHVGAMGGFAGVTAALPRLAAIGFTAIELMPIADFAGRHNWGYDGVLPYAPDAAYGTPQQLKTLIDTAHGLGVQVFLDVVYNHFGPDGNYLNDYAASFFRTDEHTPWGNAIDFRKDQVKEFFIGNAVYWLRDYRFDGLRFDAAHAIDDPAFLAEMSATIRAHFPGRHIHLVLENEHNDASLLRENAASTLYDAQWADDWHHCAHVLLTRETEGYYEDFQDPAKQLARCLSEGFAYQGERSPHQGKPRGTPSAHLPGSCFVICLQNHDQIGNRALGERLRTLAHPEALRAAIALLLFTPQIPLIFMGEEYGETRPFLYFTDFNPELGKLVTEGRRNEFKKFAAFNDPATRDRIPDPNDPATFAASIPIPADNDWSDLYATCLALRAAHIAPFMAGAVSTGAAALSDSAVLAGWRLANGARLTVATNFGPAAAACAPVEGALLFGPGLTEDGVPGLSTSLWMDA
jgi:maltooligosyltrehalose trehalohydrolase